MKKVLILATYPIVNPQHGGQKRLSAIVESYKKKFSSVRFVSVFHKKIYKEYGRDDVSLSLTTSLKAEKNPLTSDIICGQAVYDDMKVKEQLSKLLRSYQPDMLHIEQPFLYIGLKPLLVELQLSPKIVFGSQNIEAPMKREILENSGYAKKDIDDSVKIIESLEKELSQESDLLVACTQDDLLQHKAMGAKRCVLAQNGIAPLRTKSTSISRWKGLFRELDVVHKVLFVASAHPPSITGFHDMVGKGLGFLSSRERILMAGSVGDFFVESIKSNSRDIQDATFWMRAYSCGRLSEDDLVALLKLSDVIILPITEGGGSNLKTAEAILADKKVVATSHALRSFEWAADFPNIWIANTKEQFTKAVKDALAAEFKPRTAAQQKQAQTVLWEYRLSEFMQEVSKL